MPKGWVERNKLKKGDLISVNDDGFELVLKAGNADKKQEPSEISIDAKGKDVGLLKAEIVSSYLNDYDTINILFDINSKDAIKIKEVIRNLSGLEIMEQTSTRITAKNLINVNEISIRNIIRRMDIITRAMMEDLTLCSRDQCSFESIHHRDTDVNRLYYLGYRVIKNAMKNPRIARSLETEPWKLHSDTLILKKLEKIADKQKRIARFLHTAEFDRETVELLDKANMGISEAYNSVMKSYYNQDTKSAFSIEVTHKERIAGCNKFLEDYAQKHGCLKNKSVNGKLVAAAKIIENLNATAAEIRDIARVVLCYE
ncbi:phosphate uptake regulator PhoU [Candidatus Woesearchaeota archaeon]|nr:phosphate uptake regulator PhoU [Candidatus Woesearchaeota archaeon]